MTDHDMDEGFIVSATLRGLVAQLSPEQKAAVVKEVQTVLDNGKERRSREGDDGTWAKNLAEHILQVPMK